MATKKSNLKAVRKNNSKKTTVRTAKKTPKKTIKTKKSAVKRKTTSKKKSTNKKTSKKKEKPPKRKNVSQTIPNGTILQTRDEFLDGQKGYKKEGYEKKGNYRKVVVIDSNRDNDVAVVKLYSKSGQDLPSKKAKFKPFVETLDDNKNRIRESGKFIPNGQTLEKSDVVAIKKESFTAPKVRFKNKKKVRKIKGRE